MPMGWPGRCSGYPESARGTREGNMITGMTAFAERSFTSGAIRMKITIKTLNHRFFDWSYKGTPIGEAEGRLRNICQERIHRGRVEVGLEIVFLDPASWEFKFNEGLLEKIISTIDRTAKRTGRPMQASFDGLLRIPQLYDLRRRSLTAAESAFLEKGFGKTVDDIIRIRLREGRETAADARKHLVKIKAAVEKVDRTFAAQPALLKRRFNKRMLELNDGRHVLPETRVAEEVNLLVQRHDVAEEISRLKMHVADCAMLLGGKKGGTIGKQLDFLAQELQRETNTINSKSPDITITRECLAMKAEIESIREQAQNLE